MKPLNTTPHPTDALLLQVRMPDATRDLPGLLARLSQSWPAPRAALQADSGLVYIYLDLDSRADLGRAEAAALEKALAGMTPPLEDVRVSRLQRVFEVAGASADAARAFHYVVEMDPEAGWMPQLSEWYDSEHMPGLATVPGCIRASRYLNHDHGPLSLACYDLVTPETLGSPPWLAVRGTEWSSRMRPRFTNTRRTMFEAID
jgi:hypothetical protein